MPNGHGGVVAEEETADGRCDGRAEHAPEVEDDGTFALDKKIVELIPTKNDLRI